MNEERLDLTQIQKMREKRRRRHVRLLAAAFVALTVLLVWLTGIGSAYMMRAGDLLETIQIALFPGRGFPVTLQTSGSIQTAPLTSAAVLMDADGVYVISDSGSQLRSFSLNYANPQLAAGRTRFCVYNQGGKELRVEDRSRSLSTLTMPQAILFAAMGRGGQLAVATKSDNYQAQIQVYSSTIEEAFIWYCSGEYPTAAALSPNGKTLAAGTFFSGGGTLSSAVYLVDARGQQARAERQGSLAVRVDYLDRSTLRVLYDDAAVLYHCGSGELTQTAEYLYPAPLLRLSSDGDELLLVLGNESQTDGIQFVVLDGALQQVWQQTGGAVQDCLLYRDTVWLMEKDAVSWHALKPGKNDAADGRQTLDYRARRLMNIDGPAVLTARQLEKLTAAS